MSTLDTWLVDIDAIECTEQGYLNIDQAHLIHKLGGCIKPMVVREIGINKYKVVCGINTFRNVQYIVENIDPDMEMIRCYITKNDEEEKLLTELYQMS